MKSSKVNLARSTVVVVIMLCFSKVLGLVREILLAYRFGTSYVVDIYTICLSFPSIILAMFVSGVSNAYIPVASRIGEGKHKLFFNKCVTLMLIVSLLLCVLCYIFSDFIATVIAPGFEGEKLSLMSKSLKEIVIMIPFFTVFMLLSSHLMLKEKFIVSNFCDYIITNTIVILSILLVVGENLSFLIVGYVLSIIVSTIVLVIYAIKTKEISYRPSFSFKDNDIWCIFKLAIPLGISLLMNQLNTVIDNAFASSIGEGVPSAMNYANKIQTIALSLTTSIFMSMCYPRMNHYFAIAEDNNAMYYVKKGISISCFVAIPMAAFLFCYSDMVINLIFEYGAFSSQSTKVVAECLSYYAIGIPFYAMTVALTNALAGKQMQKRILKNTILTVVLNVLLNFLLMNIFEYRGLALATSLSGLFSFFITLIDLKLLKLKCLDKTVLIDVLKNVGALVCALLSSFLLICLLQNIVATKLLFIMIITLFFCVYLLTAFLFKTAILKWIKEKIFQIINKKGKCEE